MLERDTSPAGPLIWRVELDQGATMRRIMTDMEIWIGAYNAALTGLLAATEGVRHDPISNIQTIADVCKTFADQAVKDALERGKRQA